MNNHLIDIQDLSIGFDTDDGAFTAVDTVSFTMTTGEIVGLVGESGCGKSVTALSILRLIPSPPGIVQNGRIFFQGRDLLTAPVKDLRAIRGAAISMIFQEPSAALSPLRRIGDQMIEALRLHTHMDKATARKTAEVWLEKVKIPDAAERMYAYPFQLSGGMQQRVMIAMALMLEPNLIIADEPTTALDVTIQAQVFHLIREMRRDETSILLITHDMGVVWDMCDRVLVMYAGQIVEEGPVNALFERPSHPYTRGLLRSIPKLSGHKGALFAIPGQVPSPMNYPTGCRFQDRCTHAIDRCKVEQPAMAALSPEHRAACFKALSLVNQPVEER
jgi:oligopeptide/dipeptide ABC transporter ATP-binding protein